MPRSAERHGGAQAGSIVVGATSVPVRRRRGAAWGSGGLGAGRASGRGRPQRRIGRGAPAHGQWVVALATACEQSASWDTAIADGSAAPPATLFARASASVLYWMIALPPTTRS